MSPLILPLVLPLFGLLPAPLPQERPAEADPEPIPLAPGRLELGVEGSPRGVVVADLDGDGRDELLVATQAPGRLLVYQDLAPELASLGTPLEVPTEDFGLGPYLSAEGEVLLGLRGSKTLLGLRLDLVERRLAEYRRVELGATPRVLSVEACDWLDDQPGRTLVATSSDELLVVGAEVEARLPLADSLPTALQPIPGGLAVASQGTNSLIFYRAGVGPAGLVLEPAQRLALGGVPRSLACVDLDGDGDDELLGLFGDDSAVVLGFGASGGLAPWLDPAGEAPAHQVWSCGKLPLHLTVADLDLDGREEVLAVFMADLLVMVLDDFTDAGPQGINGVYAGANPWQSAAGDLNADGFVDVAVSSPSSGAVTVLFGQDPSTPDAPLGGLTSAPNWEATQAPHSMTAGDFDGDGRPDLCLLSALEDRAVLLFGEPGGLTPPLAVAVPAEADELLALELDGRPGDEVVMVHQDPDGSHLAVLARGPARPGAGPGARTGFVVCTTRGGPPQAVEAAGLLGVDLDRDGRAELLVADAAGKAVHVLRPRLAPAAPGAAGPGLTLTVEPFAELLVQGRPGPMAAVRAPASEGGQVLGLAIGLATTDGGALTLAQVDGAGQLRVVGNLTLPRAPKDLVAADLDADGRTDLVALCQGVNDNAAGQLHLFLAPNDERLGWTTLTPLPIGPKAFSVAARDLNGDGAAELFASSQYAFRVDAFVGDPTTGRPRPSWRLGAHRGCMDLEFIEVDGRPELAVSNNHSSDVSLLRFPR